MRIPCFVLVLVVSTTCCVAQSGGIVSLRLNMAYGSARVITDVNAGTYSPTDDACYCPSYAGFEGTYASQLVGVDFAFTPLFHGGIDLGVQSILARATEPGEPLYTPLPDGSIFAITTRYDAALSVFDGITRVYLSYYLPATFYVELGARMIVNVSNNIRSSYQVDKPEGAVFEESLLVGRTVSADRRTIVMFDGSLSDVPPQRYAADLSLGQSHTFGDVTIQLAAAFQLELSSIREPDTFRASTTMASLSFLYRI